MKIERIKYLRNKYDYSQKYVADKLNISQSQYYKIEAGINQITLDKLKILATLYNTSIDFILERTDNINPYPERNEK